MLQSNLSWMTTDPRLKAEGHFFNIASCSAGDETICQFKGKFHPITSKCDCVFVKIHGSYIYTSLQSRAAS